MTAYFVYHPRTWRELLLPHLLTAERRYEIADTVELPAIDYTNFIEDLVADRDFLDAPEPVPDPAAEPLRCLLVRMTGAREGILVIPDRSAHVLLAAFYHPEP